MLLFKIMTLLVTKDSKNTKTQTALRKPDLFPSLDDQFLPEDEDRSHFRSVVFISCIRGTLDEGKTPKAE